METQAAEPTTQAMDELTKKFYQCGHISKSDIFDAAHRYAISEEDVLAAWNRSGQKGQWVYGVFS